MFENLTDKLERSFKILKGEGRITEINVAESLKEIDSAAQTGTLRCDESGGYGAGSQY